MDGLRRILGFVWILLGLAAGYYFLVSQAIPQFQSDNSEDLVPAIIYTFVLTPIITGGLIVFGVYALQGEYDRRKIDE
ncbi:DUF6814 family protein [Olivibacter sitiensis]|uniref:DUF6814 family protein n=1 Tax=Olivibacter sitiensis TaxID=376470 RepID=UPI0003FCF6EF|nr:hypothetical protein [Olivibacter sitiensis]